MARVTIAALSTENAQLRALLADYAHQTRCDRREILRLKSLVVAAAPTRPTVNSRADAIKRYFAAHPKAKSVSHADLTAFARA